MYEPPEYWEDLLKRQPDLTGVAHPQMPLELNAGLYRNMRRQVVAAVRDNDVRMRGSSVLDIGSGTGFWLAMWSDLGASSRSAVDLTATATAELRERFPDVTVTQADVGAPELDVEGTFDVVSAMSILLHIVDEDRFDQALDNLVARISPEGWLFVIDPAVRHRWWGDEVTAGSNSVPRRLDEWTRQMERRGLRLVDVSPVSCLLNNVADTRRRWQFRTLTRYWYHLGKALTRFPALRRPVVSVLASADSVLLRTGWSPSSKLLVFRRS